MQATRLILLEKHRAHQQRVHNCISGVPFSFTNWDSENNILWASTTHVKYLLFTIDDRPYQKAFIIDFIWKSKAFLPHIRYSHQALFAPFPFSPITFPHYVVCPLPCEFTLSPQAKSSSSLPLLPRRSIIVPGPLAISTGRNASGGEN